MSRRVPRMGRMRSAFALLLLTHGIAHLVFAQPWLTTRVPGSAVVSPRLRLLRGRIGIGRGVSRGLSLLWLVAGLALIVVAVGWLRHATWAVPALIGVSGLSLIMTLFWWPATRIGAAIDAAILAGLAAVAVVTFRADMHHARERVSGATVVQTSAGPIEYATLGEGTPVLALHGTAGGWDQGLSAASGIVQHGYRVIAPSRFGYLRTPPRADASPALEADTWTLLLDSLGIEKVAVLSWSAGAAPAMQLALRHPDRVSKLVFFVPGAGGLMPPRPGPPRWVVDLTFRWDFPIWAAQRLMPATMLGWVAVPASLVPSLAPEDSAALAEAIDGIFPVSARHDGMLYDARSQSGAFGLFPIERVVVPTLWISAEDDLYGTLDVARHASAAIPNATLLQYRTGGHLLLGRAAEYWPQVARFLRD